MDNLKISKLTGELGKILGTKVSLGEIEDEEEVTQKLLGVINAYQENNNTTTFLARLIKGEVQKEKISSLASKFHLLEEEQRILFYVHLEVDIQKEIILILKNLFPAKEKINYMVMDKTDLAILLPIRNQEEEEIRDFANTIISTLNAEAMVKATLSVSDVFSSLYDCKKAFSEAKYAMKVGKMFCYGNYVFYFGELGVGRIVAETPIAVCQRFIEEVFGKGKTLSMDEETMALINTFLKHNLNIAESSRALHMHRNTLLYRMEQIYKNTGLDIRNFEDAMTLKIAIMALNYINQNETKR